MRNLYFTFIINIVVILLVAVACGGTQPTATESKAGQTEPGLSPTSPPAAPPTATRTEAAQSPTAVSGVTHKAINMSGSNLPGSTIDSELTEQIVVGREYDEKKPEILELNWTVPVDAKKIYFGFGVKNGPQQLVFTQTLMLNGERVPLKDLVPLPVPPSSPGKKQFLARGLAVKSGQQFPEGRYAIEVYSDGNLIQKTNWDVKRPASATFNIGGEMIALAMGFHWFSDLVVNIQQIDPDIFEVIEEPIEMVDEDLSYYDEQDLEQVYKDLDSADTEYAPFPEEIQQAIEGEDDQTNASQCGQAGGTYDSSEDVCTVSNDPAQACEDLGGTYEKDTCSFAPYEEIPLVGGDEATPVSTEEPSELLPPEETPPPEGPSELLPTEEPLPPEEP